MPKVLIDTNLMLLLAVGMTDRSYIEKHGRLDAFGPDDFDALVELVDQFTGIVCCPNVWTETSNLARYAKGSRAEEISQTLQKLVTGSEEVYLPSSSGVLRGEYVRLGLTDAVLLAIAQTGSTLLTDDRHLYYAAAVAGFSAINYNHLREARYDRAR